jgi:AraC-like DNA-binding protein
MSGITQPPITKLDSDDFGAGHDMRPWREAVARSVLGLDFKALVEGRFRAEMTATDLGGTILSRTRITPALTLRDRELADRNTETFTFAMAEKRTLEVGQRGRTLSLRRGQAALLASDEIGQIASPHGGIYTALLLPKARLLDKVPDIDRKIMQLQPATSGRMKLVLSYAQLCADTARFADAQVLFLMGEHLVNLVALTLETEQDDEAFRGHSSVVASRLQVIRAVLEKVIDDPDLSLNRLALHCGLSPRSLQFAFERAGTSYSDFLLNLRLNKAFSLLTTDPQMRIIDVALASGFADVSYFNRRFRIRFGDTPTGIRGSQPCEAPTEVS